jgi:hypothetical protein
MQQCLLLAGGQHLAIVSAVGIAFAGNAVSVSVPVAGSGLGTVFTYRQFRRHRVSDAATLTGEGEHHTQLVPGALVAPRPRRQAFARDSHDDPREVNSDA